MRGFWTSVIIIFITSSLFAEETFEYDSKGKRDPFVMLLSDKGVYASDAYGIKGINDIRLEGIVWDGVEGDSIAIINGEIVREGQMIGDVEVLKIDKDSVLFDVEGDKVKIDLSNEDEKVIE